MKITQVKTAFKIADIEYVPGSTKLNFKYLTELKDENKNPLPQSVLTKNLARVYLIVVDGEIKKIGGSQAAGGIKGTLRIYQDGGVGGRPSIRSFGIWYFLYTTILKKKKIEFYMIYQENFPKEIKGLFGFHNIKDAYVSYKLLEQCCEEDYKNKENGKYPDWNIQEQAGDWPDNVKQQHAEITQKSTKKTTSRGRKKIIF
ncbi:MAG: hypothetical protein LBL75_03945 [Rickettsiales bacterium]|jgi:hypothetical protein|nr:hypothetical protein [Rickettsiales bacterium]